MTKNEQDEFLFCVNYYVLPTEHLQEEEWYDPFQICGDEESEMEIVHKRSMFSMVQRGLHPFFSPTNMHQSFSGVSVIV